MDPLLSQRLREQADKAESDANECNNTGSENQAELQFQLPSCTHFQPSLVASSFDICICGRKKSEHVSSRALGPCTTSSSTIAHQQVAKSVKHEMRLELDSVWDDRLRLMALVLKYQPHFRPYELTTYFSRLKDLEVRMVHDKLLGALEGDPCEEKLQDAIRLYYRVASGHALGAEVILSLNLAHDKLCNLKRDMTRKRLDDCVESVRRGSAFSAEDLRELRAALSEQDQSTKNFRFLLHYVARESLKTAEERSFQDPSNEALACLREALGHAKTVGLPEKEQASASLRVEDLLRSQAQARLNNVKEGVSRHLWASSKLCSTPKDSYTIKDMHKDVTDLEMAIKHAQEIASDLDTNAALNVLVELRQRHVRAKLMNLCTDTHNSLEAWEWITAVEKTIVEGRDAGLTSADHSMLFARGCSENCCRDILWDMGLLCSDDECKRSPDELDHALSALGDIIVQMKASGWPDSLVEITRQQAQAFQATRFKQRDVLAEMRNAIEFEDRANLASCLRSAAAYGIPAGEVLVGSARRLLDDLDSERKMLPDRALYEELVGMEYQMPAEFLCPITQCKMRRPVIAADGISYEEDAIARWLQSSSRSPATHVELQHLHLTENINLRKCIQEHESETYKRCIQTASSLKQKLLTNEGRALEAQERLKKQACHLQLTRKDIALETCRTTTLWIRGFLREWHFLAAWQVTLQQEVVKRDCMKMLAVARQELSDLRTCVLECEQSVAWYRRTFCASCGIAVVVWCSWQCLTKQRWISLWPLIRL